MFRMRRTIPYQGQPAVMYQFTAYQRRFPDPLNQPQFTCSAPDTVTTLYSLDRADSRDVLCAKAEIEVPIPSCGKHKVLGLFPPKSQTTLFTCEQEYPQGDRCHQCHRAFTHGAVLLSHDQGAAWYCLCTMGEHADVISFTLDLLDWWHYAPWWQALTDKYIAKQRVAPFCHTLLFVAMAERLISLEGFHKSQAPSPTKERLRSLWRGEQCDDSITDPTLLRMYEDALHPEKWPEATLRAQTLCDLAARDQQSDWGKTVQRLSASPWLDLRDSLAVGILAAIPAVSSRHVDQHVVQESTGSGFGSPRQRGQLLLKIVKRHPLTERTYPAIRYTFQNKNGQFFRWDASLPGAPELDVDHWYRLQGTIRAHLPHGNGVLTTLYHCTDWVLADDDTEEPVFISPSAKQQQSDKVSLQWQLHDGDGRIDGHTYATVSRQWYEDDAPRVMEVVLKWPFYDLSPILKALNGMGLVRDQLDKQKDKALRRELNKHTVPASLTGFVHGFWVDDAYTSLGTAHLTETARDGASPMERQWRRPHWFEQSSDALAHARRLTMGRLLTVEHQDPAVALSALSLRGDPSYPTFLQMARQRGIHFLWEQDKQSIVPLSLKDATIIEAKPEHAAWPSQSHYSLKGINILGFSQPLPTCHDVVSPGAFLLPHPAAVETGKAISVRDLIQHKREHSRPVWYYAQLDEITAYYLRKMGARCWFVTKERELEIGLTLEMRRELGPRAEDIVTQVLPDETPATKHQSWSHWLTTQIAAQQDPLKRHLHQMA